MSYVAERQGGGPHDLLRGFDSFRNCNEKRNADLLVGNSDFREHGRRHPPRFIFQELFVRIDPVNAAPGGMPAVEAEIKVHDDPDHQTGANAQCQSKDIDKRI